MAGKLCHWGPVLALSIIMTLFVCGLYCILLWFPPWTSIAAAVHLIAFCSWLCLIMNYFLKSIWLGPGYLPFQWRPDDVKDIEMLQFCIVCNGYKAPRVHHCSNCQRCVMKMDHHCPWINNCVGHYNHRSFTLFLFFVPLGCTHATVILICCVVQQFYLMSASYYQRALFIRNAVVPFYVYHFVFFLFCIGLSVGVTIAVGILLYYQMKGILTNMTAIEAWIVEKADRYRPDGVVFKYPYHLGWKENIKQVIFRWENYVGDGISWPVIKGCDQYSLTREQLEQKQLKRERSVSFTIVKSYNGSLVGWREGIRTCLATPCTDEPRMKLELGQTVLVSRQRKFWLYGEKYYSNAGDPGNEDSYVRIFDKGWFPRRCAVKTEDHHSPKKDI